MKARVALAVVPMLISCQHQPSATCAWRASFVSVSAPPITRALAESAKPDVSIAAIVAAIGPARRDVGSGLHVPQWELVEGGVLTISVVDGCSEPMAINLSGQP